MKSTVNIIIGAVATAFGVLALLGFIKKPGSVYTDEPDEQNPFQNQRVRFIESDDDEINADGVRGHLEVVTLSTAGDNIDTSSATDMTTQAFDTRSAAGESSEGRETRETRETRRRGFYERYVKRGLDIVLSGFGLIILSPVYLLVALAVWLDDPGPVLFTQKRVGKNKQFFRLHKFRSMKMDTPANTPTHMLESPERYITKVGKFIRRTSIDELPQIWDIWLGNMSIIGPRPALWNQDKLISEREKYGANEITPGLTGLAQIKGRDELGIVDKAEIDGEYCMNISFTTDLKCFIGTVKSVLHHDGVVEGGTGEIGRRS